MHQLLAAPGDDAQTLVERAAGELEAGRLDAAERLFQQAAELIPEHPLPQLGLCEVWHKRGQLPQALEACRRARALGPQEALTALRLGPILARSEPRLGGDPGVCRRS